MDKDNNIDSNDAAAQTKPKNTPIESVIPLLEKGMSYDQIGKQLNISKQSVSGLIKRHGLLPEGSKQHRDNRADIIAHKSSAILNTLTVSQIKRMGPYQRVVAYGILFDKERLERGKGDGLIDSRQATIDINALIIQVNTILNEKREREEEVLIKGTIDAE